jgi:hypothetical protein
VPEMLALIERAETAGVARLLDVEVPQG